MTDGTRAPRLRPTSHQFRPGDLLRIRAERWRLVSATAFDTQIALDVRGCDAGNAGAAAIFLSPADAVQPLTTSKTPRITGTASFRRRACRELADAAPHPDALRTAAMADVMVMPFQLEPALAVTGGLCRRLLIADAVGLGKTIQAGLIIAEQLQRTADSRALIVTPASLRHQWCDELHQRFHLRTTLLDADQVARTRSLVSAGVNPWAIAPVIIVSIDYIKRPEVRRAVESLIWDVLVLDEAHALCGSSERAAAAAQLATRARVVVSLTATPHAGDDDAFARLCALGQLDDQAPPMLFRRTRRDIGLPSTRRVQWLTVRSTPAEAEMHRTLLDYARRVSRQSSADHRATLAMTVLIKRACSSASSLARSVERRITLLDSLGEVATDSQLLLPFESAGDEEPASLLGIPGLEDRATERALLQELLDCARFAARDERKLDALDRLLRRHRDPAIVFTEYRDTLHQVAGHLQHRDTAIVHGGMTPAERQLALRRFTHGDASLLLATDAASEGLNLHQRCRRVINVELPWTPLRLEQRIGRVDRLGQRRAVHAVHLVAGGTAEEHTVSRLLARMSRANQALPEATADTDHDEIVNAVLDIDASEPRASVPSRVRPYRTGSTALTQRAGDEAARLIVARRMIETAAPSSGDGRPFMATFRGSGRRHTWAVRLIVVDDLHQVRWTTVVGAGTTSATQPAGSQVWERVPDAVARLHAPAIAAVVENAAHTAAVALRREHDIARALEIERRSRVVLEPGLFDRRTERLASARSLAIEEALDRCRRHSATLFQLSALRLHAAELVFGVFV
jgi:superfamily II DNA or RNA helicase